MKGLEDLDLDGFGGWNPDLFLGFGIDDRARGALADEEFEETWEGDATSLLCTSICDGKKRIVGGFGLSHSDTGINGDFGKNIGSRHR